VKFAAKLFYLPLRNGFEKDDFMDRKKEMKEEIVW